MKKIGITVLVSVTMVLLIKEHHRKKTKHQ